MLHSAHDRFQGFSLMQSLLCLSLLFGLGHWLAVSLSPVWENQQAHQILRALKHHAKWAQNQAMLWQQTVAMCPIEEGQCTQNWHAEIVVFIDRNQDQQFQPQQDALLNRFYLPQSQIDLQFNQALPVVFATQSFQRNGSWIMQLPHGITRKVTLSSIGRLH